MSKNQYKKIASYEFVRNVSRMVINAPQDENYQRFLSPMSGSCDNSYVIATSVFNALTDYSSFARGDIQKDNNIYQYYCLRDVEVFGIIRNDLRFSQTDITYVAIGDQEKSKVCCERIFETIKNVTDELSS